MRFEQTAERHAGLSQFAAPFLARMKFVDEQGEGVSPTLSALRVYREHRVFTGIAVSSSTTASSSRAADVLPLDRADVPQQVGVEREVRRGGLGVCAAGDLRHETGCQPKT